MILRSNHMHSMIQTDQERPAVYSRNTDPQVDEDGTVDVWFGPTAREAEEVN